MAPLTPPAGHPGSQDEGPEHPTFDALFAGSPMMAIFRGMEVEHSVRLAGRAWDLGLGCVEVPLQDARSRRSLEAVVAAGAERGRAVGAGTITSVELVAQAAEAGAAFTVAPGLDAEVARASLAAGMPHLPGVATATEVQHARALGLTWLKAFPATVLGTGWFRAMKGPFPGVPFVATGGIDAANADAYLDAGARVVAVGSALEDPAQVDRLAEVLAARAAAPHPAPRNGPAA
ncbi:bifunctional 4-hydroxy-2-oxoglutarate aldolase/2-dehydro-3-deoxy-phosphogluconate aldolase [Streptomyces sp. HNM0574]|uniref:bifunctional 4-hydroxy-2-oxoglutarate aldolase/2-dehydro-3-deoxy-phosphogluconate aldolase n=1 Tax=Streptomyces sp. HNM0574 TaxID=2714954 RepID=UPI00146B08EC|nr:bifunctional 4-hydroxy-2-oxoglutarate aldolase/2-dehydro-3-deoxy-phosphogluconate aldolase [Streptomyces sp. HNM0574]NLU69186.1 bifunctional 4-hydroxy-2-oxoglutarate aldolase/2-dehydro-3-deoxy-phosphogluconate aldolase [Streptomyces sp. HNM0574]